MCHINNTILTFSEISNAIDAGLFDDVLIFPTIPSVDLCLQHSSDVLDISILVFPHINRPKHKKPAMYAITFVLLLRACNFDIYKTCTHMTDIWTALRNEGHNNIIYDISQHIYIDRPDEDDADFWCACSQPIKKVFLCYANSSHFILGDVCVEKTNINSINEKKKELLKVLCEHCFELFKPSSINTEICGPCSKKRTCKICNHFTKPSKNNPEICSPCNKTHTKCQTDICENYHNSKINGLCVTCQLYEDKLRREKDEQNRLRQNELNEQNRLRLIELEKQNRLRQNEINEQNRLRQIELNEQNRLRQIELAEQTRLRKLAHIENSRLRKIHINKNITQWTIDGETEMKCLDCETMISISTWCIQCKKCWKLVQ